MMYITEEKRLSPAWCSNAMTHFKQVSLITESLGRTMHIIIHINILRFRIVEMQRSDQEGSVNMLVLTHLSYKFQFEQ